MRPPVPVFKTSDSYQEAPDTPALRHIETLSDLATLLRGQATRRLVLTFDGENLSSVEIYDTYRE